MKTKCNDSIFGKEGPFVVRINHTHNRMVKPQPKNSMRAVQDWKQYGAHLFGRVKMKTGLLKKQSHCKAFFVWEGTAMTKLCMIAMQGIQDIWASRQFYGCDFVYNGDGTIRTPSRSQNKGPLFQIISATGSRCATCKINRMCFVFVQSRLGIEHVEVKNWHH